MASTSKASQKRGPTSPLDDGHAAKRKSDTHTDSYYNKGGPVVDCLPGIIYQLKLLMLFVKRALKNKYEFNLGTEVVDAPNFDDIVFRYKKKEDKKEKIRFLQAKHSMGDSKGITARQLFSKNKDANFGLPKYFTSYCEIKKNTEYRGYTIRRFILCTNIDFKYDDKDLNFNNASNSKNDNNKIVLKKIKEDDEEYQHVSLCHTGKAHYFKIVTIRTSDRQTLKEASGSGVIRDSEIEEEIDNFLKELIIAVNQPNEVDLGNIIKDEIGEDSQFNLNDAELVANSFQIDMLDWFKKKRRGEKGEEGTWLDEKKGENFFKDISQKVEALLSAGLSLAYVEKLQAYDIEFESNSLLEKLRGFLFSIDGEQNILYIFAPPKAIILSAINVCNTMDTLKKEDLYRYSRNDSYIFLRLSTLLVEETGKRAIEAFQSPDINRHKLFIINCDRKVLSNNKASVILKKVVSLSKTDNKIILIVEEDYDGGYNRSNPCHVQNNTEENDLTAESKKKLLAKQVMFQGNNIKLEDLYFERSSNDLEQLNFNTETIIELIKSELIEIVNRAPKKSDLDGVYSEILDDEVNAKVLIKRLKESDNKYFIIGGINGQDKTHSFIEIFKDADSGQAPISTEKICELKFISGELDIHHQKKGIEKIILVNDEYKEKFFKHVCRKLSLYVCSTLDNCYWIDSKNSKFMLRGIYNNKFQPRKFEFPDKITIKKEKVKDFLEYAKNCKLAFTGVETLEEALDVCKPSSVSKDCSFTGQTVILRNDETSDGTHWTELTEMNKTVHQLHLDKKNKEIVWRKSYGNLLPEDLVKIDRIKYSDDSSTEGTLINKIKNTSLIIIDKPGMGKSTSLTILSEQMLETHWVMFIQLGKCQDAIENLREPIDHDVAVEFLSGTKNLELPLEKNLARFLLQNKAGLKPLLLLFDGFDEIKKNDTKVEKLLKYLSRKTEAIIWITGREHNVTTLQNALSIFHTKLTSLEDEKEYFKIFFRKSLELSISRNELESNLEKYCKALGDTAQGIFKNANLMRVPLTLRLIAEAFRSMFKNWIVSKNLNVKKDLEHFSSISSVYQCHIDKKFEIFFKEKANISDSLGPSNETLLKENLMELHYRIAFEELFDTEQVTSLYGATKLSEAQKLNLLSIGIVTSTGNNDYKYTYRIFAEYFAAQEVVTWIKNKDYPSCKLKFLFTNILLEPKHSFIRSLINLELKKNDNIIKEIEKSKYQEAITVSWQKKTRVGQTILHVAFEEKNEKIIDLLLNVTDDKLMLEWLKVRDHYHNTVLYIAEKNDYVDFVKTLFGIIGKENDRNIQEKIILATVFRKKQDLEDEIICYLMDKSQKSGLNMPFNRSQLIPKWKSIKIFLDKPIDCQNTLEILEQEKNNNIRDYLLKSVTKKGNNILHKAARASYEKLNSNESEREKNNFDLIQHLFENYKDKIPEIDALDFKGRTALHKAARAGNEDIVNFLIGKGADSNIKDDWGNTPLRDAIRSGKLEVIKHFFTDDKFNELLDKDDMGCTALDDAAVLGRRNIVEWIIRNLNDNDKFDTDVLESAKRLAETSKNVDLLAGDSPDTKDIQDIIELLEDEIRSRTASSSSLVEKSPGQSAEQNP